MFMLRVWVLRGSGVTVETHVGPFGSREAAEAYASMVGCSVCLVPLYSIEAFAELLLDLASEERGAE